MWKPQELSIQPDRFATCLRIGKLKNTFSLKRVNLVTDISLRQITSVLFLEKFARIKELLFKRSVDAMKEVNFAALKVCLSTKRCNVDSCQINF